MRTTRSPAIPFTNSRPNSSASYCVVWPDGKTFQRAPSMSMLRVGMSGELHFSVDAGGIEHRLGSGGVRGLERRGIRRLDELDERARERGLLEHPELAARVLVVVLPRLQALEILDPLRERNDRTLDRERARHRLETLVGDRLERALQVPHETVGIGAVHDLVIERKEEVRAGADRDRVLAIRSGEHLRPLLDRAESEDRRGADWNDRRAHQRPEHAGFVMVNVASCASAGPSFFERARLARSLAAFAMPESDRSSAFLI